MNKEIYEEKRKRLRLIINDLDNSKLNLAFCLGRFGLMTHEYDDEVKGFIDRMESDEDSVYKEIVNFFGSVDLSILHPLVRKIPTLSPEELERCSKLTDEALEKELTEGIKKGLMSSLVKYCDAINESRESIAMCLGSSYELLSHYPLHSDSIQKANKLALRAFLKRLEFGESVDQLSSEIMTFLTVYQDGECLLKAL